MLLSSRLSELGWRCCPGSVLAEQRPKDVDPAAGEGDDGLAVSAAVGSFLEVVVAVRAGSHHAGLCREVADVPERAAIAQRAVQVAGAPTRVVRDGHESGCCSKVAGIGEGAQVAGTDQQRGAEERAEAGHGLNDRGLGVLLEQFFDLVVQAL